MAKFLENLPWKEAQGQCCPLQRGTQSPWAMHGVRWEPAAPMGAPSPWQGDWG